MLNKISLGARIDFLTKIWTVGTIIWGILSYFNIMPFYQVKLYKVNSVTPLIYLFPASKIRLNLDFHETTSMQDINSAKWQLLKDNEILFNTMGLQPTITLPATEGGIYQLKVITVMNDNAIKTGQTNFYVVQDNPTKITLPTATKIHLTTDNNTPEFLKNIQSNGAEVYTGNGQWKKLNTVSSTGNNITVGLEPNETLSSFGGQMLIRAHGEPKDLNNYGSVQVPLTLMVPKY